MADLFNVCDRLGASGQALTSVRLSSQFTMTTAATVEDIPGSSLTFTYDGRPVRFVVTPMLTSQDQAAAKIVTLTVVRSSDNAEVQVAKRQSDATANSTVPIALDSGPLTAWPSDSVAFVVGTSYTVKLRLLSGSSSKASTNGATQAYQFYVVTA